MGKRAGAITISLDIWHLDIPEFLECQTEAGDTRRKSFDIFPQLVIVDEFMLRVKDNRLWTLVDPYEVKQVLGYELAELWGDKFEVAYGEIESACESGKLKLFHQINARELFKMAMRTQVETGLPYMSFKDTINRANPNKHDGYIPGTNLCVAPETKILTRAGEKVISECEQQWHEVWNGSEWSMVMVRKTGENQELISLLFTDEEGNNYPLDCTYYHTFYIKNPHDKSQIIEIRAKDLQPGFELFDFTLPTGEIRKLTLSQLVPTARISDTFCFNEPLKHLGTFNGILTGQCVESYSNVSPGKYAHCCNLVSLNLATIPDDEIALQCETAVRILDNTIELTTAPFESSNAHNNRYRTIGVGAMGLADWLAVRKLKYQDKEAISNLFEDIAFHCTGASMELAKERGYYAAFPGSEWSKGKLLGAKDLNWFKANSKKFERWQWLSEQIKLNGIRNSHITAIAPNTSSSMVQGCTASILPTYSRFYYDKWSKGVLPIAPPFIGDFFWYYQENKTLDQNVVVEATAAIQQWIDTGISMELLFNLNENVYRENAITAKDIFDTMVHAWEVGCKAIYYIRTVQKDSYKEADGCTTCAN